MRYPSALLIAVVVALVGSAQAQHGHGEDFLVGVSASSGQLLVEYDPDIYPYPLPPSEDPLLSGWALDDPGLIALEEPDPEEPDFVPVDPAADVAFELLGVSSAAMKVWDPLGPGEPGFQILPGELLNFPGLGEFHEHVWWHIDNLDPAFDPLAAPWEVSFRFVDLRPAGGHLPSDPVTVQFIPEPGSALLLAVGLLLRRRAGTTEVN